MLFFSSDWTLDVTDPKVDVETGWQYAHSFKDEEDVWTAEQPPEVSRLLTEGGIVPSLSSTATGTSSSSSSRSQTWVRRRRWVRVMRRRLDIPPLPFLEPDGSMYHLAEDGSLIPYLRNSSNDVVDGEGQELGAMRSSRLSIARDYVARAKYLVGNQTRDSETNPSVIEVRRSIAKLERATTELRQGILGIGCI